MESLLYNTTRIPPLRRIGHTLVNGLPENEPSL
jgi:hypothetical protein